jgi:hypothetical protein
MTTRVIQSEPALAVNVDSPRFANISMIVMSWSISASEGRRKARSCAAAGKRAGHAKPGPQLGLPQYVCSSPFSLRFQSFDKTSLTEYSLN